MCSARFVAFVPIVVAFALGACQKTSAPVASVPTASAAKSDPNRVEVVLSDQGFVPNRIPAKAGVPITLVVTRKVERTCATQILIEGQEGKTDLPLNKTVEVIYTPPKAGEVKFGCAMGMMIGGVLVITE